MENNNEIKKTNVFDAGFTSEKNNDLVEIALNQTNQAKYIYRQLQIPTVQTTILVAHRCLLPTAS